MAAHLPDEAIAEILSRLPARSIARSRTVCKAWNAISSLPVVDRGLARRSATVTTIMSDGDACLVPGGGGRPFDDVVVRFDRFRGRWHPDVHGKGPSPRGFSLGDDMAFSAVDFRSWDGVLCTRAFEPVAADVLRNLSANACAAVPAGSPPPARTEKEQYVLWNPVTNACAVVPAPAPDAGNGNGRLIGGYAHPVTGRFHLLHSSGVAVAGEHGLFSPVTVRILRVGGEDDDTGWRKVPLPRSRTIAAMKGEGDHSVSLHGNLHWLVRPVSAKKAAAAAALLVFDTAREEFRLMAAPPELPGLDPTTAWLRLMPAGGGDGGKLCVLALTRQRAPALEVWVLGDYSDPWRSWRLRDTIRTDGAAAAVDLSSPARLAAVEVVEGAREGEEVLIQRERGVIDAYSLRRGAWRRVFAGRYCAAVLVHRDSVVPPEVSFGPTALRGFSRGRVKGCRRDWDWKLWYTVRRNAADIPLEWYDVKRVEGSYVVVPSPPRSQLAPPEEPDDPSHPI